MRLGGLRFIKSLQESTKAFGLEAQYEQFQTLPARQNVIVFDWAQFLVPATVGPGAMRRNVFLVLLTVTHPETNTTKIEGAFPVSVFISLSTGRAAHQWEFNPPPNL
jgi:hypothetical protein